MWDVETGVLVERLEGHRDSVYSIAFTPDDKGLVSGSLDRTLKFWDVSKLSMSDAKRKDGPGGSSSATDPGAPGQGVAVMKIDGDEGSPCTMNFIGHKVLFLFVFPLLVGQASLSGDCRTMFSPLPSRTMGNGSSQVPKTVEFNSGTPNRQRYSVCFRAIRIRLFPLA